MQNGGYDKFIDEVNAKINDKTIPEFGIFPPISADLMLDDDSCLVFQVKPSKEDAAKKRMEMNFVNAKTQKMSSRLKIYNNKNALLQFIKSIDKEDLKNIIEDFKSSTK